MVGLIGADGKKPIHVSENNQLEALKGDSVARETGSVGQVFNRIKAIRYHDGFFEFDLKPDPYDLRDKMLMSVAEVFTKLGKMRQMLRKAPLVDPKMAAEMLIELERKLIEALDEDQTQLKSIQEAIIAQEKAKLAHQQEDAANGIIRNNQEN